jgi:NADH-quinone oxidoreductase subunit A
MDPIGDARKRFNVRFYIVAMLFLLFDVEIVFFYPWATLFPRLNMGPDLTEQPTAAQLSQAGFESMPQTAADYHKAGYEHYASVFDMSTAGFEGAFLLIEMLIFIGILLVGYIYAWRKGAFQWN